MATFTYKGADEEDAKYTETVPVNAGNYTVKATIAETANYQSGTATADFSIAKADLEGLPSVAADDLEYNGTEQVLLPITVPDGVTVEYFFASITEEDYKGSYDPTVQVKFLIVQPYQKRQTLDTMLSSIKWMEAIITTTNCLQELSRLPFIPLRLLK
jgi:hypothetical protein